MWRHMNLFIALCLYFSSELIMSFSIYPLIVDAFLLIFSHFLIIFILPTKQTVSIEFHLSYYYIGIIFVINVIKDRWKANIDNPA